MVLLFVSVPWPRAFPVPASLFLFLLQFFPLNWSLCSQTRRLLILPETLGVFFRVIFVGALVVAFPALCVPFAWLSLPPFIYKPFQRF